MSVVVEDAKTSWDGKFEELAFIFLELKELNYQWSKFIPTSIETTAVSQCYVIVNSWQYTLGCMFSKPSERKIYVRPVCFFFFKCLSQKIKNVIITAVITSLE